MSVPGLPVCWSQGSTEQEALENIRDAIREYLCVANEQLKDADVREVEVTVYRAHRRSRHQRLRARGLHRVMGLA